MRAVRTLPSWTLVAATVLAQIAYPLTSGAVRDRLTVVTVVLFAAASLTHALVTRGPRTAAVLVTVAGGLGLAVEAVGTATGFPFGAYSYTGSLGPTVLGVPWVIPLAWTMMAWPAWLVAGRLARRTPVRVALAGWALASWDVFLDPQMVDAGHWTWAGGDIPLTNYAGWLGVALVMTALLSTVADRSGHDDRPMYTLYLWTYFSSVLAHAVFLDLPDSAFWGGLAMGPVAIPLAVVLWRSRR
ncbi:MAG TPA: carotenoid biosynthesis protein [Mycobacteriales bacterium]|nr:carotenoid biosynthesis protein [Mycobacteriales bacterium]